jgi:nucleoside diphosphate kinase
MSEATLVLIKPDGVRRNLIGEIISRCEAKGYTVAALKKLTPKVVQNLVHGSDSLESAERELALWF